MSTLHTTLAQDSFRLYFGVIDYVIEHLKKDLKKKGHDEEEATEIVNKLQSKWKENLHKSHCIDNKNMMGLLDATSGSNQTMNIRKSYVRHRDRKYSGNRPTISGTLGNASSLNPIQPPSTSFDNIPQEMPLPNDDDEDYEEYDDNHNHNNSSLEPKRKKQRINGPPPLLNAPNVIQPNYPRNNPHIQGLGVPQIDQIHNPFTHPVTSIIHFLFLSYFISFILALNAKYNN